MSFHPVRKSLLATLMVTGAPLAAAAAWHCGNPDLEVTCTEARCAASEAFTPLAVTLRDDGRMEVCAYSGCFDGRTRVLRSGRYTFFRADTLARQHPGEPLRDVIVMVDAADRIGFIKGAAFAMPLACERR